MISKKKFEDGVLGERSRKESMALCNNNNNNRDEKEFWYWIISFGTIQYNMHPINFWMVPDKGVWSLKRNRCSDSRFSAWMTEVTVSFHLLLAELTTLCKLLKLLKYYTIFPLSSYKEWTWGFGHLHLALLLNNTITNTTILCYQSTVFASTQETANANQEINSISIYLHSERDHFIEWKPESQIC